MTRVAVLVGCPIETVRDNRLAAAPRPLVVRYVQVGPYVRWKGRRVEPSPFNDLVEMALAQRHEHLRRVGQCREIGVRVAGLHRLLLRKLIYTDGDETTLLC